MNLRLHIAAAVALLLAGASSIHAATFTTTDQFARDFPFSVAGSLVVENPFGNVEVLGSDEPGLSVTYQKVTRSADKAALTEGREQVKVLIDGDQRTRFIRALMPATRGTRWSSVVNLTIRIPKSAHVKVTTNSSERIRLTNIVGNVFVKNFAATIALENVAGATTIDTVNGNIMYVGRPMANVTLGTVNGSIEMRVPGDANFRWAADTIKGDFLTSLPVSGAFNGSQFRGHVNAPEGPVVTTNSMMGNVVMLASGTQRKQAQSVRAAIPRAPRTPTGPGPVMVSDSSAAPVVRTIEQAVVPGSLTYATSLGNVNVGEVRGNAHIETGAGEVQLGTVAGDCVVVSLGGPLHLGDVLGVINARTAAGDILVHAARQGGSLTTGGGTVRLLYTAGPMTISSGGGDIVVRQALAGVQAETRSGDITVSLDRTVKSDHVLAKTGKGSVTINVGPQFAGDVDITIVTSDPDTHMVRSDFAGFSVKREQFEGKTRIRATGKINGGGEKLEIYAEDGGVQVQSLSSAPNSVQPAR